MRWACLAVAMLLTLEARGAPNVEFPYVAYVNSADVYVRSGPGRDYYPTDKLQKGEKVEIYRHDPGGWYAIRPPRQSFSWVSSRSLDPLDDGLAAVNAKRVVARVGSAFSDVRDVIQVRLDKGEKVELFEPTSGESPWCKIAPPAGEFRWIFSKFVDSDGGAQVAAAEREAADGKSDADVRPSSRGGPDVRLAAGALEANPRTGTRPSYSASGARALPNLATEFERQRELDRVDLDLSTMVVEEISAWSFVDLLRRTETVLSAAETSLERGRARVMLNKLARFADIKERHEAVRGAEVGADRVAVGSMGSRRSDEPRFDGVGRLAPVVSQKVGGPQYALVDKSNAVLSFITAAPGVNLRPYVDQYVGVTGQCGYMTDLQRQHIAVQRVTLLDVQRR